MFRPSLTLLSGAVRASTSTPSSSILTSHLSKTHLPPALARSSKPHKSLYQLLSSLPNDGVGFRVRQRRWAAKGLDVPAEIDLKEHLRKVHAGEKKVEEKEGEYGCYWEITKVRLKDGGKHGKAWGRFVWRGKSAFIKRMEEERKSADLCLCLCNGRQKVDRSRNRRTH